ncbi:MAG TPA: TldD/PmbA family protein [Firmicutes bacterium]|nr:TldD/PmbA family protein [Candidatus Fermentithermobacillaceae bacterium]
MMIVEESKKRGIESCLVSQESRTTMLNFEFNRLKNIQDSEDVNHAVQVIRDGRLGLFTTTEVDPTADFLDRAIELSQFGPTVGYHFPDPEDPGAPLIFDPRVRDMSLDTMMTLGEELIDFAKSLDPAANGSARIIKIHTKKSVQNSRGLSSAWEKTEFTVVLAVDFVEGQNLLQVSDFSTSTHLEYDLEELKSQVKRDFDLARKNVPLAPGTYPVLFTPGAFMDLIMPILACLDGKAVVRQVSPLKGRLGESIFSPLLTIVEDGILDKGTGSNLYDDQGVRCRRTLLVDKGVLREYLLDLETACKLGRKPTGTGRISRIAPNNLLVLPQDLSWKDMVKGIKRGVIIKDTMGAWAGNPYSGQVTGNIALGFLVEDGEPVGRVKDCMFSVNVFKHLKDNLVSLSRETKYTYGNALLPYALVDGVSIAAKT